MKAQQIFETVTAQLIDDIEAGADEWRMPWHKLASIGTPESVDGRPYRGINSVWLPLKASARDWTTGVWGTYRAWQRHGAQVRRGEKGTPIILWTQTTPPPPSDDDQGDDTDEPRTARRWYARGWTVFAAEQVDDATEIVTRTAARRAPGEAPQRIAQAETYFAALGATVIEGGNEACYLPARDVIHVPALAQFTDAEHFYSTLAHEHVHWTGHPERCGRDLSGRFGDDRYGAEELIAELGAAMWSAQTGITQATRKDHAAYLASWLKILRANPKHLASIAWLAQQAMDWMNTRADVHARQLAT